MGKKLAERICYLLLCFKLVRLAGRKAAPTLSPSWPPNGIEPKASERGNDGAGSENGEFKLAPFLPKTALS